MKVDLLEGSESGPAIARSFELGRVLLQRVAFEAPKVRLLDLAAIDRNDVQFEVSSEVSDRVNDVYELLLTVNVKVTSGGKKAVDISVEYIGTFRVTGYSDAEAAGLVRSRGAEHIYPYAREMIHSTANRCGLHNLALPHFKFDTAG